MVLKHCEMSDFTAGAPDTGVGSITNSMPSALGLDSTVITAVLPEPITTSTTAIVFAPIALLATTALPTTMDTGCTNDTRITYSSLPTCINPLPSNTISSLSFPLTVSNHRSSTPRSLSPQYNNNRNRNIHIIALLALLIALGIHLRNRLRRKKQSVLVEQQQPPLSEIQHTQRASVFEYPSAGGLYSPATEEHASRTRTLGRRVRFASNVPSSVASLPSYSASQEADSESCHAPEPVKEIEGVVMGKLGKGREKKRGSVSGGSEASSYVSEWDSSLVDKYEGSSLYSDSNAGSGEGLSSSSKQPQRSIGASNTNDGSTYHTAQTTPIKPNISLPPPIPTPTNLHSLFYIYELTFTSMWTTHVPMAIHHVVAFFIFFVYVNDIGTISVATLLPFVLHSTFWVLLSLVNTLNYYRLLGAYNVVLVSVGFTCLLNTFTIVPWDSLAWTTYPSAMASPHCIHPLPLVITPTPHILGFLATLEACVNYYSYCEKDGGTLCVQGGYFVSCVALFTFFCVFAYLCAYLMILDGYAPLPVLLGQMEGCGGGFWCVDTTRKPDWKNTQGYVVMNQKVVKIMDEEKKEQ
ncbi:hypothetical protein BCR33DRAFT_847343 [Rhizoclosmatium globosum]|uniref:Uncharacterized protein n=1 Tax=Rhizoclosmatium globosum TaxID=329046 RepID=A0A1Y2CQM7_9FUNG|nr:hypothetical protein BCR33DRAFT_847343 [Rhizoclosmatium globosum]|eukprot:ORY49339.1 hypothetical protein BCR33DRAFT_847343 [Rhizoclosmatium globosum]